VLEEKALRPALMCGLDKLQLCTNNLRYQVLLMGLILTAFDHSHYWSSICKCMILQSTAP
jgi:hypothetical protein